MKLTVFDWNLNRVLLLFSALYLLFSCSSEERKIQYRDGALPPEEAIQTYRLPDGFKIELLVAEPLLSNPTDMAVDEEGRIFVTEMIGYPAEMNNTGKVKLLLDTDGDGKIDQSINFAEHLKFPNGVMAWKGGILVTDAPHVIFFKDTDGDGVADIRDTILSGFPLTSPHVLVNHPRYELDNWIHLANYGPIGASRFKEEFGDRGSEIIFLNEEKSPRLPQSANSKNVRFKPGELKLEMMSTRSQFGMAMNEWGDRFLTSNAIHIYEEVLRSEYLNRNELFAITDASAQIYDHGRQSEVFQIRENPDKKELEVLPQITTSTGGISYYSGGAFPPPYDKDVTFVTESAFNLIHSDKLIPSGVTYEAQRIEENQDFLASTDEWARPVNTYVGPDGALYILDFYQMIIEHPEFMAEEQYRLYTDDFYKGQLMGRIYRITSESQGPTDWIGNLNLGNASDEDLVGYLADRNSWWRGTAQRLLVDRKAVGMKGLLERMVSDGKRPEGRLHALWTLEGLNILEPKIVVTALRDLHPGVKRNAIQIAEQFLLDSDQVVSALYALSGDPDPKVEFQLLNTLGFMTDEKSWQVRKEILLSNIGDSWFHTAAMTATEVQSDRLLHDLIKRWSGYPDQEDAYLSLMEGLAALVGAEGNQKAVFGLIDQSLNAGNHRPEKLNSRLLNGLIKGLERSGKADEMVAAKEELLIRTFFNHPSEPLREYAFQLLRLRKDRPDSKIIEERIQKSLANAKNPNLDASYRAQMLEFLTLADPAAHLQDLENFVTTSPNPLLQKSALKVLDKMEGNTVSQVLVAHWDQVAPSNKEVALEMFLKGEERVSALLEAVKDGQIPTKDISLTFKPKLLSTVGREHRDRVVALLNPEDSGDEKLREYRKETLRLTENGNIEQVVKGAAQFKTHCALCHQIQGGMGVDYGPDLGMIKGWAYEDLLANILDPNMSIAQGFDLWRIKLKSGEEMTGLITGESQNSLELQDSPGSVVTIMKDQVESREMGEISAMPPGFESIMSPAEMSDLLLFLRKNIDDVIRVR